MTPNQAVPRILAHKRAVHVVDPYPVYVFRLVAYFANVCTYKEFYYTEISEPCLAPIPASQNAQHRPYKRIAAKTAPFMRRREC